MKNNTCIFDNLVSCTKEKCPYSCPIRMREERDYEDYDDVPGYDCEDYDE